MKPIIRIENISKQYRLGQRQVAYATLRDSLAGALRLSVKHRRARRRANEMLWALRDVSFDVVPGDVVGIIGRNGAGKSTLLKILSRITEPTTGCADIYGRVGSLLEVGTGFHPELTGRENVYLNGALLGMRKSEIARQFDEIVAYAEIDKFIDTPVKFYSSGMYVRLAFAVAAHLDPEILIIDEVLAVGDLSFQKKCLRKMDQVAGEGRTILFVSHSMDAIRRVCKKAILLSEGKVLAGGDTKNVIDEYLEILAEAPPTSPSYTPASVYHDLSVLINGRSSEGLVSWKPGSPLQLSVTAASDEPSRCPLIDIAFYRVDGLKLFAIKGEQLAKRNIDERLTEWTVTFQIECMKLARQNIYIDVGIRQFLHEHYTALWSHAAEITVDGSEIGSEISSDSLLMPAVDVSVDRPAEVLQAVP